MKAIKYILSAALIAVGMTSCTLDATDYTEKSTENYPKTSTDAQQALAGVYQNLNRVYEAPASSNWVLISQLASDDCLGGGGNNDQTGQCYDLLTNFGTDMSYDFYKIRYQGINRANSVIDALDGITVENDADKQQWLGEAKFLRAYFYYELASMYNNIRLVTTATPQDSLVQRTPHEVWGQILMDLRDAAQNMPAVRHTDGHVDKYTAEAMLGRAWLFYTGMFCNGETIADMTSTNYNPLTSVNLPDGSTLTKQDVIGYIDDCVNNSNYKLVGDFRNLWAYTNRYTVEDAPLTKGKGLNWVENDTEVNPESMFAVKFNKRASYAYSIGYSNSIALYFGVRGQADNTVDFPFGTGWGFGPIAPNLQDDWKAEEPNDTTRRNGTIYPLENTYNGSYKWGGDNNVQETALHGMKLGAIEAIDHDGKGSGDGSTKDKIMNCFEDLMYGYDGGESGGYGNNNLQLDNIHDVVMIRFADVLLMQSELKEDVSGINEVRKRAGLPPIGSYSLEALQRERRFELAGEGIRWNDIRRWHIAAAALAKQQEVPIHYDGMATLNYRQKGGYVARYNATAGFFKIPESAIALSYGQMHQNPGWEGSDSQYTGWINSDN